jgi:hypothetical protein
MYENKGAGASLIDHKRGVTAFAFCSLGVTLAGGLLVTMAGW